MSASGTVQPFIAITDRAWFDFLRARAVDGRVDEVNFWSPSATRPMKSMLPGEPVFFRLKAPWRSIAGYGFFAHFGVMHLDEAWRMFDWRNGDPDEERFVGRIAGYRRSSPNDVRTLGVPLGCTVLRDARFWHEDRWMPWGLAEGWAPNIVRGAQERDPGRAALLLRSIEADAAFVEVAREFVPAYQVIHGDERLRRQATTVAREGQGTFRARLLDAYGRACAITGEHTEPVLDAAHIQPYLGPRSNHPQNGVLMTKEFHALFDAGLVGITPEYRVKVSPALRSRWQNGRRYYAYADKPLDNIPKDAALRPSAAALEWHLKNMFVA